MMSGRAFRTCSIVGGYTTQRTLATVVSPALWTNRSHKVVVVGGGSAGLNISHQLVRTGQFSRHDIAIIDPATWHHYQAGWTLVGGGLKKKEELRRPLPDLIDPKIKHYQDRVEKFNPEDNAIVLGNKDTVTYEQLVVAPGISINYNDTHGLPELLADPEAPVSSIYGYDTCDKTFRSIDRFRKGTALFTLPAGTVKCAGAPQKIMWLALDKWKQAGLYDPVSPNTSPIQINFATALPVMFGVPKYSKALDRLRQECGVNALFQHDLISVRGNTATFAKPDGHRVDRHFDFLHAVPKMGPHAFIKNSPLADEAGFVSVDQSTLQHAKYSNIWSAGDASSLPTSKTAAAITSQAPVLVSNLLDVMKGNQPGAIYDGYTSCPLTTEIGKVLLAEFKYGGVPKETFGWLGIDQGVPRRIFYHMKKDFFPWVYYKSMVKGTWGGPSGWIK
ncbi:Sulfide:quinone oxidoreductase/flavo-binding protein [Xylariaceae sp. FL0255]|nr:Sulfide:quinone oxidoreductase/flavo-binding protein [Xylariaceae sp. FL0255]